MNKGDDWEAISGDLTKGGKPGNVAYGTLTSISESPFQFGLIYTGSDDGKVYVTQSAGANWTDLSANFPADLWVSRVIASEHKKERVYVTLNGYRWDDFKPYVYVSENYGNSWRGIASNLPTSPVNVIKEDPKNEDVLYLGTDNGAWVSFDRGGNWHPFAEGLPNVAVHDLVIQERESDLVLGTHGRSFYMADTEVLQQMSSDNMNQIVMAELKPVNHSRRWGQSFSPWFDPFTPETEVQFYSPTNGKATVSIMNEDGLKLNEIKTEVVKGINHIDYDLSVSESGVKALKKQGVELNKAGNEVYYLPQGIYTVAVEVGGKKRTVDLEVK